MALTAKGANRLRAFSLMAAFLLVGFGVGRLVAPAPAPAPAQAAVSDSVRSALIGKRAPTTAFYGLDKRRHQLTDVVGKPTIIAVFAYNCDHCEVELPKAQAFVNQHQAAGLALWAIDGASGSLDDIKAFKQRAGLDMPLFYDPAAGLADELQVDGYPTFYWLDKDGVIRAEVPGGFDAVEFGVLLKLYGPR